MIKGWIRAAASRLGYEVRRRPAAGLPFVQRTSCDGTEFAFWIANAHTQAWWAKPEIHCDAELRFLREAAHPGAVVFDVGAHHGFQAVLAALWAGPTGAVHAFEPVGANVLVLDANCAANSLSSLHVVRAAVGRQSGRCAMAGEAVAQSSEGTTDLVSLDDYAARVGATPRLVKIDVEGFEGEVLTGCQGVLAHHPFVNLELHNDQLASYGWSAERVLGLLPWAAYEVQMMCRPDWDSVHAVGGPSEVPRSGVVNLFFRPQRK